LPTHIAIRDHPGADGFGDEPESSIAALIQTSATSDTSSATDLRHRNHRYLTALHRRTEHLVFTQSLG
jgi:hypothetical protein